MTWLGAFALLLWCFIVSDDVAKCEVYDQLLHAMIWQIEQITPVLAFFDQIRGSTLQYATMDWLATPRVVET